MITTVLVITGVLLLTYIVLYNRLIRLKNQVENSWAQIDVQLKRRADLLPALVQVVKKYAEHEKEVFKHVSDARQKMMTANTPKENAEANANIQSALKSLFAVAEDYPDLKANKNYKQLQEEISSTENRVAYARQNYNDLVMKYNTTIESIPSNIVSSLHSIFQQKEFFEATEEDKAVPNID